LKRQEQVIEQLHQALNEINEALIAQQTKFESEIKQVSEETSS
jgi:hypothetical protein